ncbi:ROK family transcriptional regulator [Mycolicibacterium sp. 018/SC-01/001]|nr:ROK family transcriptional regulator [Mycolicibacterium sp. 018/SC-01/001]
MLTLVHRHGALSRAELTRRTSLSRSTTKDLVEELVARGLAEELPAAPVSQVGRPSPIVRPGRRVVAATVIPEVDAVTVGVVAMGGAVLEMVRCATDSVPTPAETVSVAAEVIARARRTLPDTSSLTAIGVAVPGLVHGPESTVQLAPNLDWHDVRIGELLSAATGLPVYAANDANAGAVAEHLFGKHQGADHLIYVNGGTTGIGAGFVVAGGLLEGAAGYAGELGHTFVGGAQRCHCGSTGCLETEVTQAPLARLIGELERVHPGDAQPCPTDAERDVLHRQARALAIALGNAINMLNPRLVVLGGFLRAFPAYAATALREELGQRSMGGPRDLVHIVPATLGTETVVIGAAEWAFASVLADPGSVGGSL